MPEAAYAAGDRIDQKGKVIFEDTFADDTGGWPTGGNHVAVAYGKPGLSIRLEDPVKWILFQNNTFNPKEADHCLQLVVPKSPKEDGPAASGLAFLDSRDTTWELLVNSKGSALLSKYVDNAWKDISTKTDLPIKPGSLSQ